MHELSIVLNIVEAVEEMIRDQNVQLVKRIILKVGNLAGLENEALHFAWSEAIKNTSLENSIMKIESIQGKAKCFSCKNIFELTQLYDSCPNCNSFQKEIIEGKEIIIKSIEII